MVFQIQKFEKTDKKTFIWKWKVIGLAVLSYSMYEIMKMYGGGFLYSDPLGSYEQSKFSQLVAKLKIVHNFSIELNREKSHGTSSLFHPQSKAKLPDQSFSISRWPFSRQFFKFLNLKNRCCDKVTWLLSTNFLKDRQGECLGKILRLYGVWKLYKQMLLENT